MALEEKLYQYLDRLKVRYPLVAFIVDVIEVYLDRRVSRSSAELAYYLLLSVFPMLIMVISALGWLHLDANSVISFLKTVLPAQIMDLFSDYISYVFTHQSSGLFLAGLIMSITASSAGFRSLMSISAEIYGRRTFRGVWYLLTSLIFSVLLLVMVYGSIVVVLTGNWFFNWFRTQFSMLPLPKNLRWIRLMILFGIALLVLALLYRVTAPWSHQRPPVLKGAFFISILLAAASGVFSVFISLSTRYSTVYGSLASVIILMLWLYLCGNIVNLVNVLNYVWWRRKQGLPVRFLLEKQL